MEFGSDGYAVAGSYAISVVSIAGFGEGGKPIPSVESAVCDICGAWASCLWEGGKTTTTDDSMVDSRIRRSLREVVYACPEHSDEVCDELLDRYGSAGGLTQNELAAEVERRGQRPRSDDA